MRIYIFLVNAVVVALCSLILLTGPPEIPLYYARPWGEAQLAHTWEVFLLPVIMNILFILSSRFVNVTFKDEPVFVSIARSISIVQSCLIVLILIKTFLTIT